jgi:hypothetical protein
MEETERKIRGCAQENDKNQDLSGYKEYNKQLKRGI